MYVAFVLFSDAARCMKQSKRSSSGECHVWFTAKAFKAETLCTEAQCQMQVSAGYDAHWRDPLAGLQLRTFTYHRLASLIRELADKHAGDPS